MTPKTLRHKAIWSIFWSQWAYWVTVAMAIWASLNLSPGPTRTILLVTPILPGSLIIALAVWLYHACDEFIRAQILKATAIAATFTSFWTMAYSFLEFAGFPRLSMMWVGNVGWSIFILLMLRLKFS
jgi:TM2 domain-containing membrane protein YozV